MTKKNDNITKILLIVFIFFFSLNSFIIFFNEETFIAFFISIFFFLLVSLLRKSIKLLFFHTVDRIYFIFYLLLDLIAYLLNSISNEITFMDKNYNLINVLETFKLLYLKTSILFSLKFEQQNNEFFTFLDFCINNSYLVNTNLNFISNNEFENNDLDLETFSTNCLTRFFNSYNKLINSF